MGVGVKAVGVPPADAAMMSLAQWITGLSRGETIVRAVWNPTQRAS
jgi:hypothetical protein